MSHFSVTKSVIKNKSALVKALEQMENGRWKGKVEVCETPQNLYGYQGDKREQVADIIIRRKHVGGSSNDIGFIKEKDGTYAAIISDYDSGRYNKAWLDSLNQDYSSEVIIETADQNGWSWTKEEVDGEIFITCESTF